MAGNEDGSEDSQRVVDGHVAHLKISVKYHAIRINDKNLKM